MYSKHCRNSFCNYYASCKPTGKLNVYTNSFCQFKGLLRVGKMFRIVWDLFWNICFRFGHDRVACHQACNKTCHGGEPFDCDGCGMGWQLADDGKTCTGKDYCPFLKPPCYFSTIYVRYFSPLLSFTVSTSPVKSSSLMYSRALALDDGDAFLHVHWLSFWRGPLQSAKFD